MTGGHQYSRRMVGKAAAALLISVALGACSDDDASDSTLGPIPSGSATVAGTALTGTLTTGTGAPTGAGFVSVSVRLSGLGVDETIALDRATVTADQLDPLSLNSLCTPLDGGPGYAVVVTDLRRIGQGARIISVGLRLDGDIEGPGVYPGRLDVGDAQQLVTTFTGDVTIGTDQSSGTFDLRDATGAAATGSFVCAEDPVVTTTTLAAGGGEEVPGDSGPVPTPPSTIPLPTVPQATS